MSVKWRRLLCAATAVLVALPGTAFAGHMRPGLWNVVTTMTMPSMPKMSARTAARLKAMHMAVPGSGEPFAMQECITPAQAALDRMPRVGRNDTGCAPPAVKYFGSMMTGDIVCTGQVKGRGSFNAMFAGREHYTGKYAFDGTSHGRAINMRITFKADFVGSDCGKVKPLAY